MMNDYRAAYENYYRNINNNPKVEKNIRSVENIRRTKSRHGSTDFNVEKIFFKQFIGALMVLVYFSALKYIPLNNVQYIYSQSKNLMNKSMTYDDMIEGIKNINIGGYTAAAININGFTIEDLKEKSIKEKLSQCFNYINGSNKNNEEKQL